MSKVSDNVVLDFPSRMSDGRSMTDYRANCITSSMYLKNTKLNSYESRYYLINNASKVMDDINSTYYEKRLQCNSCVKNEVLPVQTIMNCDSNGACSYKVNDPNGVGIERSNTY